MQFPQLKQCAGVQPASRSALGPRFEDSTAKRNRHIALICGFRFA